MTPQTPERCGQQYGADGRANAPLYVCTLAAGHHGGCHMDIENNATWTGAGDLVEHASAAAMLLDAPRGPVSLQHDACGALLQLDTTNTVGFVNEPRRTTLRCALGMGHQNMPHRAADGTQWDTATPGAVGTVMDVQTARHYAELVRLAAPSEGDALNLGPIIERSRKANETGNTYAVDESWRDVLPLVREVMRLRRPKPAMPGDAVQRSALAGIARHIEDMRHVFAELLAATCTGCPVAPLSSNPEDGADLEPQPGCPVHGDTAELRRSLAWSAQQQDRIAAALGPEHVAPFGPDITTEVLRRIELLAEYQATHR